MRKISFVELQDIISKYNDKSILITFHSIGDTDSVASAFALSKIFNKATICAPDFITGNSKRIIEKFGLGQNVIKSDFNSNAEMAIMLDVNNFAQNRNGFCNH